MNGCSQDQYLDNHQRSGLAYRRQLAMLGKVLRAADAVVTTTAASANELKRHVQETGSQASGRMHLQWVR